MAYLFVSVRTHDDRYHGAGEWPPSPGRLYQALLAGAGLSGPAEVDSYTSALLWLEALDSPTILVPRSERGRRTQLYVPNNDLDAEAGDARRIGAIRTAKYVQPRIVERGHPWVYVWNLPSQDNAELSQIVALSERLYQFGRGVDMAWAWAEVASDEEHGVRLAEHPGHVMTPSKGGDVVLACPMQGSLESLKARYAANTRRLSIDGTGKAAKQLFSQPPKPRFVQVPYESPSARAIYELRYRSAEAGFYSWPLRRASKLIEVVRDAAFKRLTTALPNREAEIERVLIARRAAEGDGEPAAARVRIIPLPSIGHEHSDFGVRRVLVEVPADCTLRPADVHWAFSGLEVIEEQIDPETGEVDSAIALLPGVSDDMGEHYGVASAPNRTWRTVTGAALPVGASRRRIEPSRKKEEAKDGAERLHEQARAAWAVRQALRHVDVRTAVESIRVQREPFTAHGAKVEEFAPGTRFAKERLWHVEVVFKEPVRGPLVIGDGRFLGLGVMAPVRRAEGVHAFAIREGVSEQADVTTVTRALRRAVMSRVKEQVGRRIPIYFSGHEPDGTPSRKQHQHLTYVFDAARSVLLVVAPHVVERRSARPAEKEHLQALDSVLAGFRDLRAGSAGHLILEPTSLGGDDPLLVASRTWETLTPYVVTKHAKKVGASEAIAADLRVQCREAGLPVPDVDVREVRGVSGVGLVGRVRLHFKVAVAGPISLGRDRHFGGGLFTATSKSPPLTPET